MKCRRNDPPSSGVAAASDSGRMAASTSLASNVPRRTDLSIICFASTTFPSASCMCRIGASFGGTSSIDLAISDGIAIMLAPVSKTIRRVTEPLSTTLTQGISFSIVTSIVSASTLARSVLISRAAATNCCVGPSLPLGLSPSSAPVTALRPRARCTSPRPS